MMEVLNSNIDSSHSDYLMLSPAGVFEAFSVQSPTEKQKSLQELLSKKQSVKAEEWIETYSHEWLSEFTENGWVTNINTVLKAPDMPLDQFLRYVVGSLSGKRRAAIGSNEGFCLARTGYTQEEGDTLSVAAADFFDFLTRQQQRGWAIEGQAVSFFKQIDLLMPSTSFVFLWIDGSGYVLILDAEPLTNNRAFVELIWGINTSALRFSQ